MYDENNLLLGFIYQNETYYYQRILTGEIVKIINSEGLVVGEYIYDAYGNILNINGLSEIAEINPYRYKGYYHDQETNFYYCKSRYYSPEIIRWISQDEIAYLDTSSVNGCNLYMYCNNNPIVGCDPNGNVNVNALHTLNAALNKMDDDILSSKPKFYYLSQAFADYNCDNPFMVKLRLFRIVLSEEDFYKAKDRLKFSYMWYEFLKDALMKESEGSSNGFNMFSYEGGVYNNSELYLNGTLFIKGGGGIIMYYDRDVFSDDEEYFN